MPKGPGDGCPDKYINISKCYNFKNMFYTSLLAIISGNKLPFERDHLEPVAGRLKICPSPVLKYGAKG
jgi:hypothetical protein